MATLDNRYQINGLLDTSQTVLDNMDAIVNSCNTWLSYDALEGKWAVVINQAGSPEYSFDDSNIIGAVNLTTTPLQSLYNSAEVRFHNFDLRDQEDYVLLEIPANQRLPNEPDNRLIINAPMVNNQIQAQLLGLIELKQSRLDKVIQFTCDYSYVNIQAGTLIEVTNSVYGWTDKIFRVISMTEREDANTIVIDITAQEYDADVYDDTDLYEYYRERETGLIELDPLVDVSPVSPSTAVVDANGNNLIGLLTANGLMQLLKLLVADNSAASGGIYDSVFKTLYNVTGSDLTKGATLVAASVGTVTSTATQSANPSDYKPLGMITFTAPVTGRYKVDVAFDQNTGGARGGRGNDAPNFYGEPLDYVLVTGTLTSNVGNTQVWTEASGGGGCQSWQDFLLTGLANLTANTAYDLTLSCLNYTESNPTANANFTIGYNVFSVGVP